MSVYAEQSEVNKLFLEVDFDRDSTDDNSNYLERQKDFEREQGDEELLEDIQHSTSQLIGNSESQKWHKWTIVWFENKKRQLQLEIVSFM